MKPLLFHPDAEFEFDDSIGYYEERVPGLGLKLKRAVFVALLNIRNSPETWPTYKHETRKYLLTKFPFIVYYLEIPNAIWIVAIAHTSRKPNYWSERLKDKP